MCYFANIRIRAPNNKIFVVINKIKPLLKRNGAEHGFHQFPKFSFQFRGETVRKMYYKLYRVFCIEKRCPHFRFVRTFSHVSLELLTRTSLAPALDFMLFLQDVDFLSVKARNLGLCYEIFSCFLNNYLLNFYRILTTLYLRELVRLIF